MTEPGEIIWTPPAARAEASALARFAREAGFAASDYAGLHAWSVAEPEAFHQKLWDFVGVVGEKGARAVAPGADLRATRFFPDARINYAENLLAEPDERLALICHRDDGTRREVTRAGLTDLVSRLVLALRADNIGPGDRIAGIVTNDLEAIAFYLASAAIGAIWASCSPDFGPAGASDRLNQVAPRLLVAVASYGYGDKRIDTRASIAAVAACPSVERIVLIGAGESAIDYGKPQVRLEDWIAPHAPGPIAFHRQRFDAPMVILFSSGTTGRPKCIVHSGGGLLVQHKKELALHCDIGPDDRLFYFTTCGWMMWNWLISGLAVGATLITYDGNPGFPQAGRLIDLIDSEGITVFGTSAKYIDGLAKAGVHPRETHRLTTLRTVLSTGSPLLPPHFDYVYGQWKADLHLASISGGTDICACFLGGVPVWPVRRGELQAALLGMDIAALDAAGEPVIGAPGELVCRNAHLSMPVGFWGDTDGSRYASAYFSRFSGLWAHGDFVEERESGGFVILGRSDATLNPGGVRIGTAEIYRGLEGIAEVAEAVCVGQDWQGDQRIVLFVRLAEGAVLDAALGARIKAAIRAGATPRHVPARIIAIPEIPRTRSGKISEIAVRETIHGRPIQNDTALANPECLAAYRDLPELRS